MDTDREMDIRIVEILAEHDELEMMLVLGQLGSRAKRMMQNAETAGRRGDAGKEEATGAELAEAGGTAGY
jgi:hypothetical protein